MCGGLLRKAPPNADATVCAFADTECICVSSQLVVSKQIKEPVAAIAFMETLAEKVKTDREGHTLCRMQMARLHLGEGNFDECKKIVEDVAEVLGTIAEVDPLVNSSYYHVVSLLHKCLGNLAEFYTNSLLYLAYTPLETLPADQRSGLAFDLGLAALCGEKIYQFGELVSGHTACFCNFSGPGLR